MKPSEHRRVWSDFGATDLLLLGMVALWGMNFGVAKRVIFEIHPLAFNSARFAVASVVLILMLAHRGMLSLPRDAAWRCFLVGVVGHSLYQLAFIEGLFRTSAGNSALILATSPIFIALLGSRRKHERLDGLGWLGVALSFLGVGLVISRRVNLSSGGALLGDLLTLAASLLWAFYTAGLRPLVTRHGLLRTTAVTMAAGSLPMILLSLPAMLRQRWLQLSWTAWGGLAYSTFGSILLGYLLWNYGVKKIGGARTAVYSNLTPVVALLFGWAALGEPIRIVQAAGAIFILVSITLTRRPRKEATDNSATSQ